VPARAQAWWQCPKWPLAPEQLLAAALPELALEQALELLACCKRSE